jgi:uncharacterized membrane protein YccC
MNIYKQGRINQVALALRGEHFIHALRTTITIVLPVILSYSLGCLVNGIEIGLGALLVGLSDVPGDLYEKRGALVISSLVLALVSLAVLLVMNSPVLLGIVLVIFCFSFTMLSVYGDSISAIGSMSLIMMVFTMGLKPANGMYFSLFILTGGLWYMLTSIAYVYFFPYRPIRQALGECMMEVAHFLRSKAAFYQLDMPLNDCYKRVIAGHVRVSERQDALRSILLKERLVTRHQDKNIKQLIHLAAEVIDLYEQVLAIHYDYARIRQTLDDLQVLKPVNRLIQHMADELYETGIRVSHGFSAVQWPAERMNLLTGQLHAAVTTLPSLKADLISRIITNFEMIHVKIRLIGDAQHESVESDPAIPVSDAIRFANEQSFQLKHLRQHLNGNPAILRFALRITLTCLAAYLATLFLLPGKYNYWLLLTILIVARPGFSTTRKRNFQRLTGTLSGIIAAFVLLALIQQNNILALLVIVFLLGYLSFLQVNYMVSVVFITLTAIIGLHLLGGNNGDLMLQRGYETLLGSAAALTATFLFPFWESRKLKDLVTGVLIADISYLQQLRQSFLVLPFDLMGYKLARKQVFISSANLSRAYQHMLSEPKAPADADLFYQFQIFNHELYASVASMFLDRITNVQKDGNPTNIRLIDNALVYLNNSLNIIKGIPTLSTISRQSDELVKPIEGPFHKEMIEEQFRLIIDVSRNIYWQVNTMTVR